MSRDPSSPTSGTSSQIPEVRYRLSELLAELRVERSSGLFAQERFSQREIEKIFKARNTRHGKRPK